MADGAFTSTSAPGDVPALIPRLDNMATSATPELMCQERRSIVPGSTAETTASTTAHMDRYEIIDLVSDSGGDDDPEPPRPPKKKARLDVMSSIEHGETKTQPPARVRERGSIEKDREDEVDVKEESVGAEIRAPIEDFQREINPGQTYSRDTAMSEDDTADGTRLDVDKRPDDAHILSSPTDWGDDIIIRFTDHVSFTTPRRNRPNNIKPVSRVETIQTRTGTKRRRRMIGPFVLDEDEDEGYGSFNNGPPKSNASNDAEVCDSGRDPGSRSSFSTSDATRDLSEDNTADGLELHERRKQSEDKCAEMSRRMREAAVAKRKADVRESDQVGLSEAFLEDLSEPKRTTTSTGLGIGRSANQRRSEQASIADEDKLFGGDDFSRGDIEDQLDLAEAFVNGNGGLPCPKDLSRSRSPSASASGMEQADHVAELDSGNNDRKHEVQGSIQHLRKQLLNGGRCKTPTSGIEHHDLQQAEKYWSKVNKAERRRKKCSKERETERERSSTLLFARGDCDPMPVTDGAWREDEAGLLVVKEPLRAPPNVIGGLTQLVKHAAKKKGTNSELSDAGDLLKPSQNSVRPSSTINCLASVGHSFEKSLWKKGATMREQKMDIENLMDAFIKTAKYWCIAFDTMSRRCQRTIESELLELKGFADPILRGYSFRERGKNRITEIKTNMARRVKKHLKLDGSANSPSRYAIERRLVQLMGHERFQRGTNLLRELLMQYEEHRAKQKNRSHSQRRKSLPNSNACGVMSQGEAEQTSFGMDESDPYEGLYITGKKRDAWQREDAKIEQIKQRLANYEKDAAPTGPGQPRKKVHFADQDLRDLWNNELDRAQISDSVESDEDGDETAPSFGRGEDHRMSMASGPDPVVANTETARTDVSGKGLLSSQVRIVNEEATQSSHISPQLAISRKRLPAQNRNAHLSKEKQNPKSQTMGDMGGKSISKVEQHEDEIQLSETEASDMEQSQHDADELRSETDDSLSYDDNASAVHDDLYTVQYDIVADYDSFDGYRDATSVPLGRHIDIKAALRHMKRVATDIAGLASRRYRQLRLIWDTDDFELAAQTIILPTGGECRVRVVKSWAPETGWPGKQQIRTGVTPKVFYVVHETRKTSLRPTVDSGEDGEDDTLFGPENFEDPQALVEKERDMCFSSRQCANETAMKRLTTFRSRHRCAEDAAGTPSTAQLAEYMEQIEHDKVCFEWEKRFWIETKEARKGKEELKIWVEEMIADMPHL